MCTNGCSSVMFRSSTTNRYVHNFHHVVVDYIVGKDDTPFRLYHSYIHHETKLYKLTKHDTKNVDNNTWDFLIY